MSQIHADSVGSSSEQQKLRGSLNAFVIIFLVMAIVAPVAGVTQPLALSFALGNGAGVPSTVILATVVMLCFAAGYAAMSQHVSETGAFYAYITKGLGRPIGGAAAFVALLAYVAGFCAMCGSIGYFTWAFVLEHTSFDAPWWAYTAVALAIIFVLGLRNIEAGARVQMALVTLELAILVAFDVGVVVRYGLDAFSLSAFSASSIWGGGWDGFSVAIMFAFFLFGGVEMAAVYAEESRNPERTVGRATYGAVLVIGAFYCVTAICMMGATGIAQVQERALENPGMFAFDVVGQVLGAPAATVLTVLVITSVLASMIGLHSAVSRYIVALARDGLLPRGLAHLHPVLSAPQRAGTLAIVIASLITLAFALAGGDAFMTFFASLSGLTVLGQMTLWVAASLAFVVYFRRHGDPRWITTFVLPLVAFVAMGACICLVISRYTLVTGTDIAWINNLPWLLVPMVVLGAGMMLYLRSKKPEAYAQIWPDDAGAPVRADDVPAVGSHEAEAPHGHLRTEGALTD